MCWHGEVGCHQGAMALAPLWARTDQGTAQGEHHEHRAALSLLPRQSCGQRDPFGCHDLSFWEAVPSASEYLKFLLVSPLVSFALSVEDFFITRKV